MGMVGRKTIGESKGTAVISVPGDFWPQWHARSGRLLGTGVTFAYLNDKSPIAKRTRDDRSCLKKEN